MVMSFSKGARTTNYWSLEEDPWKRTGSRCCILLRQGSMSRKKRQCEVEKEQ